MMNKSNKFFDSETREALVRLSPYVIIILTLIPVPFMAAIPEVFSRSTTTFYLSLGSFNILSAFGILMLRYLKTKPKEYQQQANLSRKELTNQLKCISEIHDLVRRIKTQTDISEHVSSVWTDVERQQVVSLLSDSIKDTLSGSFLESIEQKYGKTIFSNYQNTRLNEIWVDSKSRLQNEIESLSLRSNINLVIGVSTTLLAVVLLTFIVLSDEFSSTDIGTILIHFLPRLSIVIFIETFSYFFLRLYKSGLSDIKYYQNELTNVEARQLALETSLFENITDRSHSVITELAKTDRNNCISQNTSDSINSSVDLKDLEVIVRKLSNIVSKASSE
ncbi:hypothetical protein [Gimesia fumaroli]|uniref:Uncharacterized protein n=1 Tax=Gimesia fumaroli TaxID=2527976 RepID=A0A518ICV0_9PLAN|nr:hypothetical protein [Gimesia fumaroli]QDV50869.1 hypothetical protein Enr17x_29140 [Gimesia fumaroli]